MVDGTGPTLTVIRNRANGRIAGGYTSIPWLTRNGYVDDKEAYLFSADNKERYATKSSGYSLYDHTSYGPTFGHGHDIHVANVANANLNSYSAMGTGYDLPLGVAAGTTAA